MAAVCGLAALAGCVSYASYPPVAKNTAINDPNSPAMEEVMMAGLRWVASKYPPVPVSPTGEQPDRPADVAVNLPPGVKPNVYRRVAAAVPGGQPLIPENANLPTYHVASIRVRGDEANVWIFRPAMDLGPSPTGGPVYQEVKLWLRGGLQPWHVVSSLEQTPGTGEVPELSYYREEEPPVRHAAGPMDSTYKPAPKAVATGQEQTPPAGDAPMPQTEPPPAGQPR
jgi:hypothetical protein